MIQHGLLKYLIGLAVIACAYAFLARVGLAFAVFGSNGTLVWPADAVAIAGLILLGPRYWPGVLIGVFLGALPTTDYGLVLIFAVGASLQAYAASRMLTRESVAFDPGLTTIADVGRLVVLGGILPATISATVGVVGIFAYGYVTLGTVWDLWLTWYLGVVLGIVLVAPPILLSVTAIREKDLPLKIVGRIILFTAACLFFSMIAYHSDISADMQALVSFSPFLLAIIGAIYCRVLTPTLCSLCIAIVAVWSASEGLGPFLKEDLKTSLAFIYGTVGVGSLLTLVLAVAFGERRRALADLENVVANLEKAVEERTAHLQDEIVVREKAESDLKEAAQRDVLTGLPNRTLLLEQLSIACNHADRSGQRVAIVFLDLNNFKPINDNLGHVVGDEVLRKISRRINRTVRESDLRGRWGGDEIVLGLTHLGSLIDIDDVVVKVQSAISDPMILEDSIVQVTASAGIALYPDDGRDMKQLIHYADEAMYRAKRSGGSVDYAYFSEIADFRKSLDIG